MELKKLSEIRAELIAAEENITESKKELLVELNYLAEKGLIK